MAFEYGLVVSRWVRVKNYIIRQ